MKSNRTRFVAALVVGSLAGILGVVLIIGYVSEAVVASAGEADNSLLFWYLSFFLFGFIFLVSGISAVIWGVRNLRKINKLNSPAEQVKRIILLDCNS